MDVCFSIEEEISFVGITSNDETEILAMRMLSLGRLHVSCFEGLPRVRVDAINIQCALILVNWCICVVIFIFQYLKSHEKLYYLK